MILTAWAGQYAYNTPGASHIWILRAFLLCMDYGLLVFHLIGLLLPGIEGRAGFRGQ